MCSERTKHLQYKYYGLSVKMFLTSQESYLSHINMSKQILKHVLIASVNHVGRDSDLNKCNILLY